MENEVKNNSIYDQVVDQIKELIFERSIKKGDKLPTERALAEQLKVSRTSVREALRALEIIGLIESRQGAGNYIKSDFQGGLFQPLSTMFILNEGKTRDIMEFREMLEIQMVTLAAERAVEQDIRELREILKELKESDEEWESTWLDKQFHYKIAMASDNILIINILQVLSQLIDEFIMDARKSIFEAEHTWSNLIIHHERILKAIENKDVDGAYKAMKAHFDLIREHFKEL
ncbi:FadR/GntR family transcriptional regulator [Alloiococcus sp. CFN-8]|uniref:FadR/GntR family transcriptional regulator n=1 Tax=Alloiococcus sp. CFN-8 TaxID=3416081 RepID=UPI003CE8F4F1